MPPPTTVSGCDLPRVELPGDGVEALMADRLDIPNDWQVVRVLADGNGRR
jgi:hypothetical protein